MDRLTQKETAGRNLINGRYMLNECLFASDLGTLYKARDTRQGKAGGERTGVLIHFLPNRTIAYDELPDLFSLSQSYTETLDCPVLNVVDYGWSGTVAYFIMLAPESWSVNVLPELQGTPSSLHQKAIRITRDLLQKQIIGIGLVPQAFLVMPGGLYVLPTALIDRFQVLQHREALLPLKGRVGKSGRWMSFLGWGTAVGFAVSGSGYIHHLYQQDGIVRNVPLQEPLVRKSESQIAAPKTVIPAKENDLLLIAQSVPVSFGSSQLDRPEVDNQAGNLFTEAVTKEAAAKEAAAKEVAAKEVAAKEAAAKEAAAKEAAAREAAAKEAAAREAAAKEAAARAAAAREAAAKEAASREAAAKAEVFPVKHEKTSTFTGEEGELSKKAPRQNIGGEGVNSNPVSPNIQVSQTATIKPVTQSQQRPVVHSEPIQNLPVAIKPAPVVPAIPKTQPVRVAAVEPATLTANHLGRSTRPRGRPEVGAERRNNSPVSKASGPNSKKSSQKSPRLTANGWTSEQLIDYGYKAIREGQLGEVAGRGALYFIRLIKRIDRGNPQINRMARKVVSTYHIKARDAIRNKNESTARQLLWMAGRTIKEFNLTKMNRSHEILNHRIDE